jgi:hypothetical protein
MKAKTKAANSTESIAASKSPSVKSCLTSVTFPSVPDTIFRVDLRELNQEEYFLEIESKRTHEKWRCIISNISEYGPNLEIPRSVFYNFLYVAFHNIMVDNNETKKSQDDPTIDLHEGKMLLTLTIQISKLWAPQYVFPMTPVGLEAVDMLAAQLRDMQDEITLLKREAAEHRAGANYLSISSQTACGNNGFVQWNGNTPRCISEGYELSENCTQVTVTHTGLYFINIRLGQTNNANQQALGLQVNGTEIAQCVL